MNHTQSQGLKCVSEWNGLGSLRSIRRLRRLIPALFFTFCLMGVTSYVNLPRDRRLADPSLQESS
jgi:hypothetical protein